jgi:transcriptional regulator with XRE-family HTH domain
MTKNGKPETIGKRLRRLRLERHLSQRDLSTTRENLTEALLAAVGQERERDRLRDEQARLAERERALR